MATTMAASHGIERRCVSCGLSYRYPKAAQFSCESCGARQSWEPLPGIAKSVRERQLPSDVAALAPRTPDVPAPISLIAVAAMLNHASSDTVRQLHDRLAILRYVDDANTDPRSEYFNLVQRLLSGAGLKL